MAGSIPNSLVEEPVSGNKNVFRQGAEKSEYLEFNGKAGVTIYPGHMLAVEAASGTGNLSSINYILATGTSRENVVPFVAEEATGHRTLDTAYDAGETIQARRANAGAVFQGIIAIGTSNAEHPEIKAGTPIYAANTGLVSTTAIATTATLLAVHPIGFAIEDVPATPANETSDDYVRRVSVYYYG